MKENIHLKTLISISLLIFCLPFLQTCSDKSLKKLPAYKSEFSGFIQDTINTKFEYNKTTKSYDTVINLIKVSKIEKQKIIAKDKIEKKIWLKNSKKEFTYNAYFLGFGNYKNFETSFFADKNFYVMLNFTLLIIFTFIMFLISFRKKFKKIIIMSSLNLVFLFTATIALCFWEQIEDIRQIKYGYYLFVLNSILIIVESRKEYKILKTKT